MSDTKPITTPYDPDASLHEFGWLWLQPEGHTERERDWILIQTFEDDDGELAFVAFASDGPHDVQDVWRAEEYRHTPYMPLSAPSCGPWAGAMVHVWLPGGLIITTSHEECGPEAQTTIDMTLSALGLASVIPGSFRR